ncbi:hypothetical protein [Actinoplanes regularis]|uniref:hypothetical protein n=1 Tax=Actinoplanes regularis TaxID=52697 RepID=UPI0024A2777A|nr:hypothetical protein [Actinoplanes regularis]GLW34475.1 hypothetical protein Areg01_74120 [Actinoplanes regularis]
MLSRKAAAIVAAVGVLVGLALPGVAHAGDEIVVCPPVGPCKVVVIGDPDDGGGGGDGGEGGGSPGLAGCKTSLAQPQPPAGDPLWEGHEPGDGAVYMKMCKTAGGPLGIGWTTTFFWAATAPAQLIDPALLAEQAIKLLPIKGPDITTAPRAGGSGLVGLPIWVWTPAAESTWGPSTRTASVPGVSVTATANATKIVYQMGDGTSITCTKPGTPYRESFGRKASPDCGYAKGYQKPSSTVPGGTYKVTGVTTWHITWAGGGDAGELTVTRTSAPVAIDIDELQAVTS